MSGMEPFILGMGAAGGSAAAAGTMGSLAAAGSLIGTGTAAGIGAGLGLGLGTIAPIAGTVLSGVSALGQYNSMQSQARSMQQAAKIEQQQLNIQANQEAAVSQREAIQRRRESELAASRAIAVAASSGAGTSGIEGILRGIAGRGEENAQYALYEGQERATTARYRGQVGVAQAGQRAAAMRSQATATLMGGFASMGSGLYSRFA
jgi:hypothetical protein